MKSTSVPQIEMHELRRSRSFSAHTIGSRKSRAAGRSTRL